MARLGSWIEPFPEGIYIKPADAWVDPAVPKPRALVGAYALGKAQRLIAELRCRGHEAPIYIHGALQRLCDLYREHGVDLGDVRPATGVAKDELRGKIVVAPPGALNDRWSRRLPEPITAMASGSMR